MNGFLIVRVKCPTLPLIVTSLTIKQSTLISKTPTNSNVDHMKPESTKIVHLNQQNEQSQFVDTTIFVIKLQQTIRNLTKIYLTLSLLPH